MGQIEYSFIRCRNCSKFVSQDKTVATQYCSTKCAHQYERCRTCGKFFLKSDGKNKDYCSEQCSKKYTQSSI